MAPKLYVDKVSPPARAALMCANAINLDLDVIEIRLFEFDHRKPEYIKLNPLHTVPTLDDDGFILCDSHAIMGYLIGKYSKNKSLYPDDVHRRAAIDQRLHFDCGILFARHFRLGMSILYKEEAKIVEENRKAIKEAYGFVEIFLEGSKYIAGNDLSIADFSIVTTITNASVFTPLDEAVYPNIVAWRNLLKTLPCFEINEAGGEQFKALMQSKLSE